MHRALELAARGEGQVEPNPMVGCVIARGDEVLGEGWHERFGAAHAEVNALADARQKHGDAARGATAYVTLEPCCHTGKTPPCTDALIEAGVSRVVAAVRDPFPQVDGGGFARLTAEGITVESGVADREARCLLAPYLKRVTTGRPWVIAKWAMTLDGKIATRTGSSQWISSPESRALVHELRGRMDAILIGRRTAIADDPLLTARVSDPAQRKRVATRVVLGAPPRDSQLVRTAGDAPLLIIARDEGSAEELSWAREAGADVMPVNAQGNAARLAAVMDELGRRGMTNVLVEGGRGVLGAALDAGQIDEVHVFIGPKLVGGQPAPSPVGGEGIESMSAAALLWGLQVEISGGDAYLHGRVAPADKRDVS